MLERRNNTCLLGVLFKTLNIQLSVKISTNAFKNPTLHIQNYDFFEWAYGLK